MPVTRVRIPHFPLYSTVRRLLPICDGVPKATVLGLINACRDQMGTPQKPVDWSEPDTWIPARLSGDLAALATRIWEASERTVNSSYIYGAYRFCNSYALLSTVAGGVYHLTERGRAFLDGDPAISRELDEAEGLLHVLAILAPKARARRGDLLGEWGQYLREFSAYASPASVKGTLGERLQNLVERGYVGRDGMTYAITAGGLTYLGSSPSPDPKPRPGVLEAIKAFNDAQRLVLRERLGAMHPYRFEHLVRDLLDVMGYERVAVTSQSGDKGVDVVATIQFGITTIQEVVQVKRHRGTLTRPVLDQLRGSLPYHKALKGTLITLGTFSQGCAEAAFFPGAAPITLIDGDRLLDLLIEHQIGIQQRPATLLEVDDGYFQEPGEPADSPEAGAATSA